MTAKCGTCYWNVNRGACAVEEMMRRNGHCPDHRPAKKYEHGRPKGGRGGA